MNWDISALTEEYLDSLVDAVVSAYLNNNTNKECVDVCNDV
jgi:hypothetical protein